MKFTNSGNGPQEEVIAAKQMVQKMHNDGPIQGPVQKWKVSAETQTTPNIFATRHFTPIHNNSYSKSHYSIAMAEVRKQEKDFTKEVDELLPEATTLAKVCREWHTMCPTNCTDLFTSSLVNFQMPWRNCLHWRSRHEMYAPFPLTIYFY